MDHDPEAAGVLREHRGLGLPDGLAEGEVLGEGTGVELASSTAWASGS